MILEINDSSTFLLSLLGKLLKVIHIAIPILLVVFITVDLVKALLSQDDEMVSKTVRSIRNRMIAAIVVFFIPTIVEFMLSKVFITLNMDSNEYNKIMSSYKTFIHPDKLNINSSNKSNDINGKMAYSIGTEEDPQVLKNEINFANYSKTLTTYMFDKNSFKDVLLPIVSENFKINYKDKTYKLSDNLSIKYDSITTNETVDNGDYVIGVVTLDKAVIENEKYENVVVNYYYLKTTDSYKLEKIDLTAKEEVSDYLTQTRKSEDIENKSKLSVVKYTSSNSDYDYSKLEGLSNDSIKSVYEKNKESIFSFNTSTDGNLAHATGFSIRSGIVATSWSYLKTSLVIGKYITAHDFNGTIYNISGVVSIDEANDIVVLKLGKEVGKEVVLASKDTLAKNDPIISITSKTGYAFSAIAGVVSSNNSNLINVLPITKNDWGSPVFDINGSVVGITTAKIISSELSDAASISGLQKLKSDLAGVSFKDIKCQSIDDLKKEFYYVESNKEKVEKTIPTKTWKEYKKIGDIENTIALDLVKASYYEKTVSLRYSNLSTKYSSNFDGAILFRDKLLSQGYKEVSKSDQKIIYQKNNKKVIIISEFDYLIIILVDGGIL